jgi:hypothetical protein
MSSLEEKKSIRAEKSALRSKDILEPAIRNQDNGKY